MREGRYHFPKICQSFSRQTFISALFRSFSKVFRNRSAGFGLYLAESLNFLYTSSMELACDQVQEWLEELDSEDDTLLVVLFNDSGVTFFISSSIHSTISELSLSTHLPENQELQNVFMAKLSMKKRISSILPSRRRTVS